MARNKAGTKSGWKRRDRQYREDLRKVRRAKRERSTALALFQVMAGRA